MAAIILIQIGLPLSVAVLSFGVLKHATRAAAKKQLQRGQGCRSKDVGGWGVAR